MEHSVTRELVSDVYKGRRGAWRGGEVYTVYTCHGPLAENTCPCEPRAARGVGAAPGAARRPITVSPVRPEGPARPGPRRSRPSSGGGGSMARGSQPHNGTATVFATPLLSAFSPPRPPQTAGPVAMFTLRNAPACRSIARPPARSGIDPVRLLDCPALRRGT